MVRRRSLLAAVPAAALSGVASSANAVVPAPALKFDVSICLDSATLLWVPLRPIGAPPGLMHRPLRRLEDGTFRSAIVTARAAWTTSNTLRLLNRIQILLLKGEMHVGDIVVKERSFTCLPPGYVAKIDIAPGSEFLMITDGEPMFESAAMPAQNPEAIFLQNLVYEKTRMVWRDPETGGTTHFVTVPAGWHNDGPEVHPCQEEIFWLSGDIAPDDIRIMTPGWFLWNPINGVHGWNLHSTAGGTGLEWHDRLYSRTVVKG
jgi:hypothetical protein